MNVSVDSSENGVVRASVTGKINQSNVSPFVEPLADAVGDNAYAKKVVLDMSGVELLDSSGVSWSWAAWSTAAPNCSP